MPLLAKLFKKTKKQEDHVSGSDSGSPASPPVSGASTRIAANQQETLMIPSSRIIVNDEAMTSEDLSCLRSLAFPEIFYRRQEADTAYSHTCEWILQHKSYTTWLGSERGLLWIKGKPGSGKSTLMAFIYRVFHEEPISKQSLSLDFFFHGRGAVLQKTPVGMFRTLLHQLYDKIPSVRPSVRAAFREKRKLGEAGAGWEWQRKELEDHFSNAIIYAAKSRTTTIFVDALDEAGADCAMELATYFHNLNKRLAAENATVRICISCRHYPIPSSDTILNVHVEDENHDDIAKYVQETLDNELPGLELAAFSIQECQTLKKTIVERALGVFMWARLIIPLVVGFIRDGESMSFISVEINKVPLDLINVYKHILETVIPSRNRKKTLLLMQWVCLAERPLSVTELRYAMASDDSCVEQFCKGTGDFVDTDARMQKQITSLSGGLVEVRIHEAKTTVQFIHQSVNDFLRSQGLMYLSSAANDLRPQSPGELTLSADTVVGQSHNRLCKSCINYLGLDEVLCASSDFSPKDYMWDRDDVHSWPKKLPFVLYATKYWFLHAEKAEVLGILQQDLVRQLGSPPGPTFRAWIKIIRETDRYDAKLPRKGSTLLHIASVSNLQSVVQILLDDNRNVNIQDDDGNTALHCAARWGHTAVVKMLLDAGADIRARNNAQSTALERAAANGHGETLQLLLRRGADVNDSTGSTGTALQAAAEQGKYIVVEILLENGAEVNAQGGEYGNALQAAAVEGNEAVVQLLLEKGADVNMQGGYCGNALQAAAFRGNEAVIQLLLEKGAKINTQGGKYGNALQAAATRENEALVHLLLEKGAKVNTQGEKYGNALQAAAFRGNEAVVQLLLEKGADVNTQGGYYGNALQAAALEGNEAVVQLLLEKGADVNTQGGYYGNALQAAALEGNEAVVQLLLEKGADVNTQGGYYGNALQAAATRENEALVHLLLEKGAKVNTQGEKYGNALQAAALEGNEAVVQLLLEKGADVNMQGGYCGNALQAAALEGNEAVVQLLLENGAEVNAQGGEYGNALQAAAVEGNEAVVQLLLEMGAVKP